MTRKLGLSITAAFIFATLFPWSGSAQSDPRGKRYTLRGTVEAVNDFANSIRVNQEKIDGYSDARVATYRVDDPEMLKKLEVDDQIVATIYEKEDVLHDIRVVRIADAPPAPLRLK
jgi:hypothetical protein